MRGWLVIVSALLMFVRPGHAADPNQMFQTFIGTLGQLQQLEQQNRQQREQQRQQRLAFIHQMVTACKSHDEVACTQIIETKDMPPFANYLAFLHMGDIELRRGDRAGAQSSFGHAIRWASRMQNAAGARQAAIERLAALNQAPEQSRTVAVVRPVTQEAPSGATNPPPPKSHRGDAVCDAASSVKWKIACLEVSESTDGSKLYAALGDALGPTNATLRELMECEAKLSQQPEAGLNCYRDRGFSGTSLETVRQHALEYDLLIDVRLNGKR